MSSRPSTMTLTKPGAVRLYSTEELLTLPPPEWLIDGILPAGGLCAMYGRPGSFKTFVALDMMLAVATGHPWQGREVQKGFGLYVSAEGSPGGLAKRIQTWLTLRGKAITDARVSWLTEAIYMHDESEQVSKLFDRIDFEVRAAPSFVVIDTLARCFMGDENKQEDMGKFVGGIDALRLEWGATVLIIHHTRLDGDRERGNTAFRGAADTMMSISRQKGTKLLLECDKQKEAKEFDPIHLTWVEVEATDSCVIEDVEAEMVYDPEAKMARLLQILTDHEGVIDWALWLSLSGLPKATFARLVHKLRDQGVIVGERGVYRFANRRKEV